MLTLLTKYAKPYVLMALPGVLLLFGQAAAELYLPNLMSGIVNRGLARGDLSAIYSTGAKMLAVALAGTVCAIGASFLSSRLALGIGRDVRAAVFRKVEGFSLHEYESFGAASLITRTTNDVVQVQQMIMMGFRFVIYSPIMCVGGVLMALSTDVTLSGVFAVSIPLLALVMFVIASFVIPSFTVMQEKIDGLNLVLRENLTGIRVIRSFNKTEYENRRFAAANRGMMDVAVRVNKVMALTMPAVTLIMNVTIVAAIWFGGIRISQGRMDVGGMMAFTQYATQIMMSVLMVAVMFVMIPRAQASSVRINEVLEKESGVKDPAKPQPPGASRGQVEFRHVSFRYPDSETPVLEDISFTSRAGETVAIIGGTGSGKSTIVNLIPRFYDVTGGSVLVGGVDVRQMSQAELRAKIGFVTQAPVLFSGSISDNLRIGKKDATGEEIERAAKVAQAYGFVSDMPEKFQAEVSQAGVNLSGGQKQRLSFARAIVRKPEIYIFDDSFSALDFKTDAALRAALKSETRDATVIVVAQRVSSIMDADRIIVVEEGKVAGMGTHKELLAACGVYREICASQLSREELA